MYTLALYKKHQVHDNPPKVVLRSVGISQFSANSEVVLSIAQKKVLPRTSYSEVRWGQPLCVCDKFGQSWVPWFLKVVVRLQLEYVNACKYDMCGASYHYLSCVHFWQQTQRQIPIWTPNLKADSKSFSFSHLGHEQKHQHWTKTAPWPAIWTLCAEVRSKWSADLSFEKFSPSTPSYLGQVLVLSLGMDQIENFDE